MKGKKEPVSERHILDKAEQIDLFSKLPRWKIDRLKIHTKPIIFSGPNPDLFSEGEFHRVHGSSISTYPHYPHSKKREGDPICDSFCIHAYENCVIVCIADGCNWGERPREASNRCKDIFVQHLENNLGNVKRLNDLGPLLVSCLDSAHQAIIVDKPDIWMAGTSTVLGGVCLQISDSGAETGWMFVGVTIGDCKTFLWSQKTQVVKDLTQGNRMNITDPRDPGGRIGPYVKGGEADLRNLMVFHVPVEENDILFFLSDGVHDNLDPQTLGKSPKEFGFDGDNWEEVDLVEGTKVKTKYMCDLLKDFIIENGHISTPKLITKKIVKYCMDLTAASREYMEQNPFLALAHDYDKYPGKMDHTTCVALKVGMFNKEKEKLMEKELDLHETLDPNIWPF